MPCLFAAHFWMTLLKSYMKYLGTEVLIICGNDSRIPGGYTARILIILGPRMSAFQPFIHWIPPGIPPQKALAGMAGMAAAWPHVPHTSVFVSRISCPVFLPPFTLSGLFSPNEIQMARLNGDPFEESRKELLMLWRDDILISLCVENKKRTRFGMVLARWVPHFLHFVIRKYKRILSWE